MDSNRKAKTPAELRIKKTANGGFIVTHHYDNFGAGDAYMPAQDHAFGNHAAMMKHVHKHTGGPSSLGDQTAGGNGAGTGTLAKGKDALPGQDSGKVTRSNVGSQHAGLTGARKAPPPSRRTYGAGVD